MGNEICEVCNSRKPTYNYAGRTPRRCTFCKSPGMVNTHHKRCEVCNSKTPSYNFAWETSPSRCYECKEMCMVPVFNKNRLCEVCKITRATYKLRGESTLRRCGKCKEPGMVHKSVCPGANNTCTYGVRSKKYDGYCTFCFTNMFPLDPRTFEIRSKSKENAVRDYINTLFEGFQHDKPLVTGHCDCTIRRRIDHRKLIGNTLLAIETDENQHKSYSMMDEEMRYNDLFMAFPGRWVYIRFNPDSYISKCGKRKNPHLSTRLRILGEEIRVQMRRIEEGLNTDLVERIYLFYDGYD